MSRIIQHVAEAVESNTRELLANNADPVMRTTLIDHATALARELAIERERRTLAETRLATVTRQLSDIETILTETKRQLASANGRVADLTDVLKRLWAMYEYMRYDNDVLENYIELDIGLLMSRAGKKMPSTAAARSRIDMKRSAPGAIQVERIVESPEKYVAVMIKSVRAHVRMVLVLATDDRTVSRAAVERTEVYAAATKWLRE
jgi:hypothetical protein